MNEPRVNGLPDRRSAWVVIPPVLLPLMLLLLACDDGAPAAPEAMIGRFPASRFLIRRDMFQAGMDPVTQPAADARFLKPRDEVFGVKVGDRARAYPITMISYHHVVNDRIGEVPIAVTY